MCTTGLESHFAHVVIAPLSASNDSRDHAAAAEGDLSDPASEGPSGTPDVLAGDDAKEAFLFREPAVAVKKHLENVEQGTSKR